MSTPLHAWVGALVLASGAMAGPPTDQLPVDAGDLLPGSVVFIPAAEKVVVAEAQPRFPEGSPRGQFADLRRVAFATPDGVQVFEVSQAPLGRMSEPWLLFWYEGSIGYNWTAYDSDKVRASRSQRTESFYESTCDRPQLVVVARHPASIRIDEHRLSLEFAQPTAAASLPLTGLRPLPAEETVRWQAGVPQRVVDQCRLWASIALNRPKSITERFSFDGDDLVLESQFTHAVVEHEFADFDPQTYSPVPPIVALAMAWGGYQAQVQPNVRDAEHASEFGPVWFVSGDRTTIRVPGIMPFVREASEVVDMPADHPAVDRLRTKLVAEVEAMMDAGLLAPVRYHFGEDRGAEFLFYTPGEFYGPLADVVEVVGEPTAARLRAYVERIAAKRPPTETWPIDEGRRREWSIHHQALIGRDRWRSPPLSAHHKAQAIHDLWRISGDTDRAVRQFTPVADALAGGPLRFACWSENRDYLGTWPCLIRIMDRPNMTTAGLIAGSRLAGLADRPALRDQLAAQAAKNLLGQSTFPALLGAYVHGDGRDDWRPPPRSVSFRYATAYVSRLGAHAGTRRTWGDRRAGSQQYQVLSNLSPEIGRFWAHLPEGFAAQAGIEDLYRYATDWYVADGPPNFHLTEMSRQPPDCAWSMFLAKAWVFRADGAELERYVDIPTARVGDVYHLQKLAVAIQSFGRRAWREAEAKDR